MGIFPNFNLFSYELKPDGHFEESDFRRKNADALKLATVESAKESERGIVDLETLKHTNETLISTLDEVMKIQSEGKERRLAAQAELADMENQLKRKMLELSRS